MKDNFSRNSQHYAQFRPTYPKEMFTYLLSLVKHKNTAWDCGTGNGQVAQELAKHFNSVYATDISENQIKHAAQKSNLNYKIEQAEKTKFPDDEFDLITVAQAIHWFDIPQFYEQVKRTLKPNGLLAVIGYGLFTVDYEIDAIVYNLYSNILDKYWDKERKLVDENYETIPFPFNEIKTPKFSSKFEWTFLQLTGYLETWSAVNHYIKKNEANPVDLIRKDLRNAWGGDVAKTVTFNIILKAGVV